MQSFYFVKVERGEKKRSIPTRKIWNNLLERVKWSFYDSGILYCQLLLQMDSKYFKTEACLTLFYCRMESTEKCEVVIQHFNGKYLKTPPGIPGESPRLTSFHLFHKKTKSSPFLVGASSQIQLQ